MLPFGLSFLAWAGATVVPSFLGLAVIFYARKVVRPAYLSAFAIGIFLWFFVDTIQGSADIDVGAGYSGGLQQVGIVALFVIGISFMLLADKDGFSSDAMISLSFTAVVLSAFAVGIHGFGEGSAAGSTAAQTSSTDILDAFGGLQAAIAYALHKAFEPMMVGALYVGYLAKGKPKRGVVADLLVLALVFTAPSLVGAATGYFISYDASYFFALGTGTAIYMLLKLAKIVIGKVEGPPVDNARLAAAIIAGFILIYAAALLHS